MSTNHTTNYNLNQWEATDKVLRTEFNADNAKIDAALKANADAIAALSTQLTSGLAGKGNCQIYTSSYTGTDTYGQSAPCSLTFPGTPLVVFIGCCGNTGMVLCAVRGQTQTYAQGSGSAINKLTWGTNSLSWSNHMSASEQMNSRFSTYQVVALLAADE